jgi:hypothetical protein
MIEKIISGGQEGAAQAALDVAIELGIPHGGWLPKGRKTENGILSDKYQLQEMSISSSLKGAEQNVFDSDGTLIFFHGKLAGRPALTQKVATKHGRPWLYLDMDIFLVDDAVKIVRSWISHHKIQVLNVAGSRAKKDPRIYTKTRKVLKAVMASKKEGGISDIEMKALKIDTFSFGFLVINGRKYTSDLIIYPEGRVVDSWWRKRGHRLSSDDIRQLIASDPDVIIAGKGVSGLMRAEPELEELLYRKGIEFVVAANEEAIELFNELSPKRKVGACFHLTC